MDDMALRSWRILSLCAGVGGLDLGVRLAESQARSVCYVEREAAAASILVARMETGGSVRRLSGLTLPPLTQELGVAQWIASCRETPASRTASPDAASAMPTSAGLLIGSSKPSTAAGLVVSSARTSRGMRTGNSPISSRHWSDWVAALRSDCSARRSLASPTDASGFSSCPTATVADSRNGRNSTAGSTPDAKAVNIADTLCDAIITRWRTPGACMAMHGPMDPAYREARGQTVSLDDQVSAWRTPQAGDATRGPKSQRGGSSSYKDPAGRHSLVTEVAHWPTPAAQNHKGSSEHSVTRVDGKSRMDILSYRAKQGFRCLHPDLPTTSGPTSSPERRTLNPLFVEWLMGWPIGWTGSAPVKTASSHWWQAMRGELSKLVSRTPRQGTLL